MSLLLTRQAHRTKKSLAALAASAVILASVPFPVSGQSTGPTLKLAPHCLLRASNPQSCPSYPPKDAETVMTSGVVKTGDIVDVDIILSTQTPADVGSVRAWLEYYPEVMEARSIELSPALGEPIPGENVIDKDAGVIKIGAGIANLAAGDTVIARVTFQLTSGIANTKVSFHEFKSSNSAKTAVLGKGSSAANLLKTKPANLLITVIPEEYQGTNTSVGINANSSAGTETANAQGVSSSRASTASSMAAQISSSAASVPLNSAFTLLQVQKVEASSQNNSIFVKWQALPSTELAGYNIYYGTVTGQYIQRRSVDKNSTSLVIRDLQPGATYYMAVRGYDSANRETIFSKEVSVVVGQPGSGTSPIGNGDVPSNPIDNGVTIPGETGLPETVFLLLLASAVIGTVLAAHRQTKARLVA